ncbi:hypothetical protein M3Y95_00575000 [Aphelenchoides besseyi]|nr:hypothetical protein M3Y95_00575000 [Aphelenchoides besseyi]
MCFRTLGILILLNAKVVETSEILFNNTHYSITNSNLPLDHWIKIIGSTGRYSEKKPVKTKGPSAQLSENVCTVSNLTACNLMREEFMCLCSLPLESSYRPFRSCTDVLKVVNIEHYVYEIHYKLNEIAVKSIVRDVDLQLGHPTFFEKSRLFFRQNISQIVKFKMSNFLYPIYYQHLEHTQTSCKQIDDPNCSNSTKCHNCTSGLFDPNHQDFWPVWIRVLLFFSIFLVVGIGYKYNNMERGVERQRARESAAKELDFEQTKRGCITTAL